MADQLSQWNDTSTRRAIVDFMRSVTDPHVPPAARVAVFGNDGTLWCGKPMPVQLDYMLPKLAAMAEQDPALRERQPWQAADAPRTADAPRGARVGQR
jgi:hypothetical protein